MLRPEIVLFLNYGSHRSGRKRKAIGTEFIRVFEEESKRLGPFDYLAQGGLPRML